MKKMKKLLTMTLLALSMGLTGCNDAAGVPDNPTQPEVTLEDALKDGTIVAMAFELNGEEFYVAFVRVGDTYELLDLDKALTRAEEPTITEKDCDFTMVHNKANNVINFTVKEKKTSDLVLTAIIDINTSTMEVIPGDPKFKVTGVKMKVSNVEITNLLKEKGEGVTLTDALVKGAKVEIVYKWEDTSTIFTFTNNGGTFSCVISGPTTKDISGSLKIDGNELFFSAKDTSWLSPEFDLEIKFNYVKNTFKFWTIKHDIYKSHTISVNGTDITSKLTKESI